MTVWYITGVSRGIGKALAQKALDRGDSVVGTCRKDADCAAFEALAPGRSMAHKLDVTDKAAVFESVAKAEKQTGGIDRIVTNAGYGLAATVEEASEQEIRDLFETNFYGTIWCIQAVLPFMRQRKAGHIIPIVSVSGLAPWGGFGIYGATKYALEGACQALAQEVAELGITVSLIEPGGVASDFDQPGSIRMGENVIDAYSGTGHVPRRIYEQPSAAGKATPEDVAKAIIGALDADPPPQHLLLGADAMFYTGQQIAALQQEMSRWAPVTLSVAPEIKAGEPKPKAFH